MHLGGHADPLHLEEARRANAVADAAGRSRGRDAYGTDLPVWLGPTTGDFDRPTPGADDRHTFATSGHELALGLSWEFQPHRPAAPRRVTCARREPQKSGLRSQIAACAYEVGDAPVVSRHR